MGSGRYRGGWGWGHGQCTIGHSQGPSGPEAGGLPWADGAGSVCGAGGHRAEPRPGCPACWGSSGSGMGHGRQEDEAEPSHPPQPPGPDRIRLPLAVTSMYSGSEAPLGHRHSSTSSCPKRMSALVVRRPRPVCSSQDSCTAVPVSLQGRSWASEGGTAGLRESLLRPLPWACTGHGYRDRPSGSAVGDGGSHGS